MSNESERPTRVLVLIERPLVADVVRLTLNHGTFVTRHARDIREACEVLDAWRPQLAIVDIDGFGDQVVRRIASWGPPGRDRLPVLAVTRRGLGAVVALDPVLNVGELEIDIVNRRVRVGSSEVLLTDTEQSLLYLLAANAGEVVTREEIRRVVWGIDDSAEDDVVEHIVTNLRDTLQNGWTEPRFIAIYPGVGYRYQPQTEQLVGMS